MIRHHGNLRPAGGGGAGSRAVVAGSVPPPLRAPRVAPGGSRQQLLALPGGPARGARLWSPPQPGRDPERVSRGSPRLPGDTERRREGRGARLCERSPSGGCGHGAPAPLWPGGQNSKAAGPFKGTEPSWRESAQRRGEPAPPGGQGHGIRGVPFPERTMAVRKPGRLSSPPRIPFGMLLPARPTPLQAAASSRRCPRVEPHHCSGSVGGVIA